MLSYQHAYHAGCLADVHKHAILSSFLSKMIEKDKPLTYMETHSGRGFYDLDSPEAQKTNEAQDGIVRLMHQKVLPLIHPYMSLLMKLHKEYGQSFYPGSPKLAQEILRKSDHIHLMELHPQEFQALKQNIKGRHIHCYKKDGYDGVLALSPPVVRRGLVFIDPSYEMKSEYDQVADFVIKLHKKWPQAVILIWYPLLAAQLHISMVKKCRQQNFPKFWHQEVSFKHHKMISSNTFMQGSGLMALNIPYGIEEDLSHIKEIL